MYRQTLLSFILIICLFTVGCASKAVDTSSVGSRHESKPDTEGKTFSVSTAEAPFPDNIMGTGRPDNTQRGTYRHTPSRSKDAYEVSKEDKATLDSLIGYEPKSKYKEDSVVGEHMRIVAMSDIAKTFSTQTALEHQYRKLVNELQKYEPVLDQFYNFKPLLLRHGEAFVLPPILAEAKQAMRLEEPDTLTTSLATYEILSDARYTTTVPTWRDYVEYEQGEIDEPHKSLLPKNREERKAWKEAILEGWELGIEQANEIFEDNIARLNRDMKGLMIYHTLADAQLITKPQFGKANLGIKKTGRSMAIDQKVFKITLPSQFNENIKDWIAKVK